MRPHILIVITGNVITKFHCTPLVHIKNSCNTLWWVKDHYLNKFVCCVCTFYCPQYYDFLARSLEKLNRVLLYKNLLYLVQLTESKFAKLVQNLFNNTYRATAPNKKDTKCRRYLPVSRMPELYANQWLHSQVMFKSSQKTHSNSVL